MKLVDFETAKALQELGYDGEYQWRWKEDTGRHTVLSVWQGIQLEPEGIPAPRLDDAAYFLRDRYGIIALAEYQPPFSCWNPYLCDTSGPRFGYCCYAKSFDNHDDALEFTLKKSIEIIKDKQDNEQET